MKTYTLILKEILHRKVNFLLSLFAVVVAVALFVFFLTTGEASRRETTRLMRDMGFNLRIVSGKTDMERFWSEGFSGHPFPEEYVKRFAAQKGLNYNHLLAMARKRIEWRGREVLLVGIAAEVCPPDKGKSPMIFSIERGTVHAGFEIARSQGMKKGAEVHLLGTPFRVANCLSESGTEDDITLYCHLEDAQALLGMEGQINEIKALECLCSEEMDDTLPLLREQLAAVLPDTRVVQIKNIAEAREKQRRMADSYFSLLSPFILVACAAWVGVLAMMNVRERRQEIGILRALGYGSGRIAALFLGKAVVIGLAGAALGFAAGTALALAFGPDIFKVTAKAMKPAVGLLGWSLAAAALFTALSTMIPTAAAVAQDPAETLRDE